MDRGLFFHSIYRIQQKLGKVFRELEPYALYPLDEYFSTVMREPVASTPAQPQTGKVIPIRPSVPPSRPAVALEGGELVRLSA